MALGVISIFATIPGLVGASVAVMLAVFSVFISMMNIMTMDLQTTGCEAMWYMGTGLELFAFYLGALGVWGQGVDAAEVMWSIWTSFLAGNAISGAANNSPSCKGY